MIFLVGVTAVAVVWTVVAVARLFYRPERPAKTILRGHPDEISRLRDEFASSDMSTEEFEGRLEGAIRSQTPGNGYYDVNAPYPPKYPVNDRAHAISADERLAEIGRKIEATGRRIEILERTEIHVHNAPPGHHLHIHLP